MIRRIFALVKSEVSKDQSVCFVNLLPDGPPRGPGKSKKTVRLENIKENKGLFDPFRANRCDKRNIGEKEGTLVRKERGIICRKVVYTCLSSLQFLIANSNRFRIETL